MNETSGHDEMCTHHSTPYVCDCNFIAKIRADERERIARAIEAERDRLLDTGCTCDAHASMGASYSNAAAIALGGAQ